MIRFFWAILLFAASQLFSCTETRTVLVNRVTTSYDSSLLLHRSQEILRLESTKSEGITLDTAQKFQKIEGFGYTLTGGSAMLIMTVLSTKDREELLQDIFGNHTVSIGVNYLRISVGPSDLDELIFSYCEEGDTSYHTFNASYDSLYLIPLLKEIKHINPKVRLMASPWSAPAWMKDNNHIKGGKLKKEMNVHYANYLVKYLQTMQNEGLEINTLTLQNEPENPHNTPSMLMSAEEQKIFILDFVGPIFKLNGIKTEILIYDHNCDHPEYPLHILEDSIASDYIKGTAFHLYAGDISSMSLVAEKFPEKKLYFTEQWTSSSGEFGNDLVWHAKNVIIGSLQQGAVSVMEWNLASDQHFNPHTSSGGCTQCKGAILINTETKKWSKNVSWYIIGQASRALPAGSWQIQLIGDREKDLVAFFTPAKTFVLLAINSKQETKSYFINFDNYSLSISVEPNTFVSVEWPILL